MQTIHDNLCWGIRSCSVLHCCSPMRLQQSPSVAAETRAYPPCIAHEYENNTRYDLYHKIDQPLSS